MARCTSHVLLFVLLIAGSAFAQNTLLSYDFNNGSSAGWQTFASGWQVVDGVYQGTNTAPNTPVESVWAAGYNWTDYILTASVNVRGTYSPSDSQVIFRYQAPTAYSACTLLRGQLGYTTGTFFTLYDTQSGYLAFVPFSYAVGQWYTITATITGTTATCEVVGHPETRLTATFPGRPTGTVGLRATHSASWFDNVQVSAGAATCTYAITLSTDSFAGEGGSGDASIQTQPGCPWTASTTDSWIHFTSTTTGTGPGQITFQLDRNTTSSLRTGHITVAGLTLPLSQQPGGGIIVVDTDLPLAQFALLGPIAEPSVNCNLISGDIMYTGSGFHFSQADVLPGTYVIKYEPVAGYVTPGCASGSLAAGATLSFRAMYVRLISFFDSFRTSNNWLTSAEDDGSCLLGVQGTLFCRENVLHNAEHHVVTLQGRIQDTVRSGGELAWRGQKYPLPLEGTFAANVRFRGTYTLPQDVGSIMSFFTYRNPDRAPCIHMEHDFELLTGSSQCYQETLLDAAAAADIGNMIKKGQTPDEDLVLRLLRTSMATGPIMTTVTHSRADVACKQTEFGQSSVTFGLLGDLLRRSSDGYVTLVVQVTCTAGCSRDALSSYYHAKYTALTQGSSLELGETDTLHDSRVDRLDPHFNLWWIDPDRTTPFSPSPAPTRPDAPWQFLDVQWFYWHSSPTLTPTTVRSDGIDCDLRGEDGENRCGTR